MCAQMTVTNAAILTIYVLSILRFGTDTKMRSSSIFPLHCLSVCVSLVLSHIPSRTFYSPSPPLSFFYTHPHSVSLPWQETTAVCHTLCNTVQVGIAKRVFLFPSKNHHLSEREGGSEPSYPGSCVGWVIGPSGVSAGKLAPGEKLNLERFIYSIIPLNH